MDKSESILSELEAVRDRAHEAWREARRRNPGERTAETKATYEAFKAAQEAYEIALAEEAS